MRKVITIVCESFNRYDVNGWKFQDFEYFHFNNYPANCSDFAMYAMQTNKDLQPTWSPDERAYPFVIPSPGEMIADYVKTRLISYPFWRSGIQDRVDPLNEKSYEGVGVEPHGRSYLDFLAFLKDRFYNSDYEHLIYWSMIGHSEQPFEKKGYRVEGENDGVPLSLEKTLKKWFYIIEHQILPHIRMQDTLVMIHNDHGTARDGIEFDKAMFDGFLYLHNPFEMPDNRVYTWADIRRLLYTGDIKCL